MIYSMAKDKKEKAKGGAKKDSGKGAPKGKK